MNDATLTRLRADYDRKTHNAMMARPEIGKTQAQWRREADEAWQALVRHFKESAAL